MAENEPFLAHCEMPPQGDVPPGPQVVWGWLVPQPTCLFHDVRVWIDQRVFLGVLGLPRPDVAGVFKRGTASLLSEFRIHVDVPSSAKLLVIEALRHDRRWVEIHRRMLRVVPGLPLPAGTAGFREEELRLLETTPPLLGFSPLLFPSLIPWLVTTLLRRHRRDGLPLAALAGPLLDIVATPSTRRQPLLPFHGFLDQPPIVARSQYDKLAVLGWVFHRERPIRRILATTGVEHLNVLTSGGPREEVPGRYPDLPPTLTLPSEFRGTVDVSSLLPNPVLKVYAELDDGSLHLCFGQRFFQVPYDEWELPLPRYDRRLFLAAARVLRSGLRARRVRGLLPFRTALAWWEAHRDYRRLAPGAGTARRLLATLHPEAPVAPDAGRGLRLLLVTHNLNFEGAPLFALEYARWMVRRAGWTIHVVSAKEGPLRAAFEEAGCTVAVVDVSGVFAATSPQRIDRAVAALAARIDLAACDLVLANTAMSFWAVHLARAAGRPSLLYIHESATISRLFFHVLDARAHPGAAAAFSLATRTCFLTPTTRRYYEDLDVQGNFAPISSWIDLARIDAFRRTHPRDALRRSHGIGDGEIVVSNIGTVIERKGQHMFIRAVDHLLRLWPDLAARCRFLLVGGRESDFQTALLADLERLGWRDRFVLVPETREVFDYYGLSDVFVCTSYEESFPRVLLEAMAFELPIVSTDVHGIPEIVEDGRDGLLMKPGDPLACAQQLKRALDALGTSRSTAPAALRRVREQFDLEHVLPGHLELARTVVRT